MSDNKLNKLFWLSGSYYMRKRIIAKIQKGIGQHSLTICDNDDNGGYISSQLSEVQLFDEKKLVILKIFPFLAKSSTTNNKRIINVLQNIPDNCFVIIDNISPTSKPTLYKAVKKIGKVFDYPKFLNRRDAITWVFNRFKEYKKEVRYKEIEFIVDSIGVEDNKGVDVDKLYVCVKKICDYLGQRSTRISREDIMKVANRHNKFIVWNLFNALDDKNLKDCFSIIDLISKSGKTQSIMSYVFMMILWRFRMLWFIKESLSQRKNKNEIIDDIQKNFHKLSHNGSGFEMNFEIDKFNDVIKPAYSVNMIRVAMTGYYNRPPSINKYDRSDIFRIIKCAKECLVKIRYGVSDVDALVLFDNLIFTIIPSQISHDDLQYNRRLSIA